MIVSEFGAKCPKHGGSVLASIIDYPDGDKDINCECGGHLAIIRDGKTYIRAGCEL